MNKVILMGRLTKDPEVRYSVNNSSMAIARYTLAVERRTKEETTADFINCVAFGKTAEFAEKFLKKGTKILIEGKIKTGKYQNKEGQNVYTTDIEVERHEFVEGKGSNDAPVVNTEKENDFMSIPDGFEDELPFN